MKKRILSIVLALLLAFPLVFTMTACGGDGGKDSGANDNGVKITFMVDSKVYHKASVVEGVFTMPANPTKTDKAFIGWYFDKGTWQQKFTNQTEVTSSITVHAYFGDPLDLNFYVNNNLYGSMKISGSSAITIPQGPTIENYEFLGWYFKNYSGMLTIKLTEDYFVNNNATTSRDVYAKLKLVTKDNSASGAYRIDGDYIYMGEYPTSLKKSNVRITSSAPDNDGYYAGSDGYRYAKVDKAEVNLRNYARAVFQDDSQIVVGETYYFKVESIKWRIAEKNNDTALVYGTQILFKHQYSSRKSNEADGKKANDYALSDVRAYLNNTLFYEIFSEKERSVILTSWVNNGKENIEWYGSPSPWADTYDKLFVPSVKEINAGNVNYISKHKLLVSDYQRATNMLICTTTLQGGDNGYSYWWNRTYNNMGDNREVWVSTITPSGERGVDNISYVYGVVPMFRIDL
jgi:hypothetical protein